MKTKFDDSLRKSIEEISKNHPDYSCYPLDDELLVGGLGIPMEVYVFRAKREHFLPLFLERALKGGGYNFEIVISPNKIVTKKGKSVETATLIQKELEEKTTQSLPLELL